MFFANVRPDHWPRRASQEGEVSPSVRVAPKSRRPAFRPARSLSRQVPCPIVFRGANGAAARVGAQHSQDYSAWYSHVPGLYVVAPFSAADAKGLLKAAIRDPNPIIFLENEILYGQSFEVPDLPDFTIPFGKARVWREGSDVTIVSFGIGLTYALHAAEELANEAFEMTVFEDFVTEEVKKGRTTMGLYPNTDPQTSIDFEAWRKKVGR